MYLGYEDILSTQPCDYRVVNSWCANHSKCRLILSTSQVYLKHRVKQRGPRLDRSCWSTLILVYTCLP